MERNVGGNVSDAHDNFYLKIADPGELRITYTYICMFITYTYICTYIYMYVCEKYKQNINFLKAPINISQPSDNFLTKDIKCFTARKILY